MTNKKRVLIFFVSFICIIYIYGILHGVVYQATLDDIDSVSIDKTSFFDVNDSSKNIVTRELQLDDSKIYMYETVFTKKELGPLKLSDHHNENIYLMIEKPDAQYIEVYLNDQNIGSFGEKEGNANIWNGTLFLPFNENIILEENKLNILMSSDYMTGVSGDIRLLSYDNYRHIESIVNSSDKLIEAAIVIAFVVAIIIGLIIVAWYKKLYNIRVYIYFMIAIVFIGISLYDFRVSQFLSIDYLLHKKIIVTSYHVSITFVTLAISTLLNARFKINLGMIGLTLILFKALTVNNMVLWRDSYQLLNLFLIAAILQLIFTLIYYRKRAAMSALVLILSFSLSAISIIKMVYITSTAQESTIIIDLPILIIMFAAVVLFVFYIELIQMVDDSDMPINHGINLNGSFTIDNNLRIVGPYTTTCNAIFDKLIVGAHIEELMYGNEDYTFIEEILTAIFNPQFDYIDGFLDLLPTEITINEKDYLVYYTVYERTGRILKVTMNDVTKSKALGKSLEDEKKLQKFFINALKSKQELSFFINKTKQFIKTLRLEGFTLDNQKQLHTLKGNLGQFGFLNFEKIIHDVESELVGEHDAENLINSVEDNLNQSIELLEKNIGKDYFTSGYQEYSIDKSDINRLEEAYLASDNQDEAFLKRIRQLRNIDIKKMLSRYNNYVDQIAQSLEKAVLPLDITGDSVLVDPEKTEALVMVLVAVFRNAVTHGIEIPDERVAKGKDSYGLVNCHIDVTEEQMILSIKDDGAGINTNEILQRAISDGIIKEDQSLTQEEILNLIFLSKMSTKDDANLLAGRGIGLSAVGDVITALSGTIDIETVIDTSTEFIIKIPVASLVD